MKKFLNSKFVFGRHGNTLPDPENDANRALSPLGIEQAEALRQKLTGITFDMVITSELRRAMQTAILAIGGGTIKHQHIPSLYPMSKKYEAMWEDLTYSPLSDYFAHPFGDAIYEHGKESAESLLKTMGDVSGKSILIIAHAVITPATMYHMFIDKEVRQFALSSNIGECGAIEVVTDREGKATVHLLN